MYVSLLSLEEEKRICEMTTFKEKAWNMTNSSNATNVATCSTFSTIFPKSRNIGKNVYSLIQYLLHFCNASIVTNITFLNIYE